ncbi:hypothetical protein YC2023_082412 [Brassica napus]
MVHTLIRWYKVLKRQVIVVERLYWSACNFDLEFIYVLSGWEGSACGNQNSHRRFSFKLGKSRNPNFPRGHGFSARANDK